MVFSMFQKIKPKGQEAPGCPAGGNFTERASEQVIYLHTDDVERSIIGSLERITDFVIHTQVNPESFCVTVAPIAYRHESSQPSVVTPPGWPLANLKRNSSNELQPVQVTSAITATFELNL
jgi:hypothetical protein